MSRRNRRIILCACTGCPKCVTTPRAVCSTAVHHEGDACTWCRRASKDGAR